MSFTKTQNNFTPKKASHWPTRFSFFNINYFNSLMKGGFVFYGGLLGGLLSCLVCGLIHKIDIKKEINDFCFLIPLVHSFGRLGCFFAGCCYGKEYDGILSVQFPKNSFAPSEISLFSIQLLEALLLLLIFKIKKNTNYSLFIYCYMV